ncbi:MAG: isoprenyl transferase [Candidatus Amulumruptor caecigallinarius]|nr:isoprenyl transferase [Candidatus Amulumruptor caecigallinarius]
MENALHPEPNQLDAARIPRHVAIIMDGNGRWARNRMQVRTAGHSEGVNSVHNITKTASDLGVKYLTLYAFSTENWNRPKEEVDTLMYLIGRAIRKEASDLKANNVHINLLGEIERLPESVREDLAEGCRMTSDCDGLNLNLCLSYSSRWEITEAVRKIVAEALSTPGFDPEVINEHTISSHLSTAGMPDPDLLIRTGGESRISNFLLWQIAYSELYFTPTLWPDFTPADFIDAIIDFQNRERRFGKTGEQVRHSTL